MAHTRLPNAEGISFRCKLDKIYDITYVPSVAIGYCVLPRGRVLWSEELVGDREVYSTSVHTVQVTTFF